MKRTLFFALFFTLHLSGLHQAIAEPRRDRIVVVISLDGFPEYALDDPRLPIPTLRKLAKEGSSAPMRPINPTVTWPNHTAMITGVNASKHHVLFNGGLVRPVSGAAPKVDPQRPKESLVQAPTVYDLAFRAGLTTAQVDWVAIQDAKTITWQFPELPNPDGKIEREMEAMGLATREQLRTFENSSQAWQDDLWTDAAIHILQRYKPNLLLLHLLSLDNASHEYGPMSAASFSAMAFLDDRVKQVIDGLKDSGLLARTTILVVSDHGFRRIDHAIHPNVLLRQHGLIRSAAASAAVGDAWVMSDGGTAGVYGTGDPDRRPEITAQVRRTLEGAEGIDKIYGPQEFSTLGWPLPAQSDQAPDLVLAAKPGYVFSNDSEGEYITPSSDKGTHGYLNSDPQMQSIFIAWGASIRKRGKLGSIANTDIAPTIARILGLSMDGTDGQSLDEILQ